MTSRFFHHDSRSRRLPSLSLTHMDFTCLMIIGDYTRNKNKNTLGRVTPNITRNFVTKCHQYIQNSDLVTLNHPLPRCFVPPSGTASASFSEITMRKGPLCLDLAARCHGEATALLCGYSCVYRYICIYIYIYIYICIYIYMYI